MPTYRILIAEPHRELRDVVPVVVQGIAMRNGEVRVRCSPDSDLFYIFKPELGEIEEVLDENV